MSRDDGGRVATTVYPEPSDTIQRAQRALDDHAWTDAYEAFVEAERERPLAGRELRGLAQAAWWTAHPQERLDALERSFAALQREGDQAAAAAVALDIADDLRQRRQPTLVKAWMQRATRLLEPLPERVEHGYLELALARRDYEAGNLEEALERADRVLDVGTRFADRDLQAYGLMLRGAVLVAQAKVEEGLALVDEATVAAVSGDLTPLTTGIIYCITITISRDLVDYQRAGEWTEAAARWCERQAISGFPGICRVHRAEIMRLRGSLLEAEDEARRAADELIAFGEMSMAGAGFYEIGEIRMRVGDLDAAEDAFAQAHQLGHDPQPGLALLHLARKRVDAARSSIATALADAWDPLARARLLPARVEISLAARDVADAREAAEELRDIAERYGAPILHAWAQRALGEVLTHEGDAAEAISKLRGAVRHWTKVDMPYEAAQTRRALAIAYRSAGDENSAALELKAARAAFEKLGAGPEALRADRMLRAGTDEGAGRRVTKTFMFTDIVGSTNLLETIGDEAWEDVARWHGETLRGLIETHGGDVVQTTGDGFFAAFEDPASAAACAVAIQRRLLEHRRSHGFAPSIRIGLHAAEATMIADDFTGLGVHAAARVGALADGGEILVTRDSVDGDFPFALANERSVSLKGLAQSVTVASVEWRDATRG
jgi:class 3 adenylate cyclase